MPWHQTPMYDLIDQEVWEGHTLNLVHILDKTNYVPIDWEVYT